MHLIEEAELLGWRRPLSDMGQLYSSRLDAQFSRHTDEWQAAKFALASMTIVVVVLLYNHASDLLVGT